MPVLTFPNLHQQLGESYIKMDASLYDYDSWSANDHIGGGPYLVWLSQLNPDSVHQFSCTGDGCQVDISFRITPLD
jgi:hypothetical protein